MKRVPLKVSMYYCEYYLFFHLSIFLTFQRKERYGSEMERLASERDSLAYLLTKQLDRLECQSGIEKCSK